MKFLLLLLGVGSIFSMDIVVPACFHPSTHKTEWDKMASDALKGTKLTVIMNAPGCPLSSSYVTVAKQMRDSKVTLISYVSSNYGNRPLNTVRDEIHNHRKWYNSHGFFIDEMGNKDNQTMLKYYRDVYLYVKSLDSKLIVVNNPGVTVKPLYLTSTAKVADRFMNFENTHTKYAAVVVNQQNDNFIHCIYNATTDQDMKNDLNLAKERNAQGIFITEKNTGKYGSLPTYWDKLVAEVNAINGSG